MELPAFLKEALSAQYAPSLYEKIMQGYGARRPVSFRVNTLRADRDDVVQELRAYGIELTPVSWYADAFYTYVTEEAMRETEAYRGGKLYLQSLSSMLPPLVLGAKEGESVLDMTAAPGGKTTQIAALTGGRALITACEKDGGRFSRLEYNVKKQGAPRVTLLHQDALKLDDFFRFDRILLDAPCSGSGTVALNGRIDFSEKLLSGCMKSQRALIKKAWGLLKKGGTLVYSTCSILQSENEDAVKELLSFPDVKIMPVELPADVPAIASPLGVTVLPSELYEGFFLSKIVKE